jgi:hypothetical protein
MKVIKNQSVTFTMQLTEDEARWLKGMVQNAIGCELKDEPFKQTEMRMKFWRALTEQGVPSV